MNDDNLDLLDLDDGTSMDALPDAAPFAAPRPKKPWLLLGLGVLVIVLATYVIVRTVGGDGSSSIEVDLDAPAVIVEGAVPADSVPAAPLQPAQPVVVAQPVAPAQQPVAQQPQPQPVATPAEPAAKQVPVRVIEDRKEVTFNPEQSVPAKKPVAAAPVKKAVQKPVAKPAAKPAPKPAAKPAASAPTYQWYVQLGSHSTRALAETAQRQMRNAHANLFSGHQIIIVPAQMKDGSTKYRLRVGFATSSAANGFCQNAKSDGLDCYVTK